MKKTIRVSIVILVVLAALVIFAEYKWYMGEAILFMIGLLAAGVLSGILLALITLVPAVRKRAQSDLAERVVAILVVMMLSAALVFSVIRWLEVQFCYIDLDFPPMVPDPDYSSLAPGAFQGFMSGYGRNSEAINRETLIRAMVPPFLRSQCYTSKKYAWYIRRSVSQKHKAIELESLLVSGCNCPGP